MALKIIDVSKYQGHIDWAKVKPQIDGAVIRIGYRGYGSTGNIVYDPLAVANIKACIANEIPYGVYFLTQAKTYAEGVEEANWVHSALARFDVKPLLPVFVDSEWSNNDHSGRADGLNKGERTQAVLGFLETLEKLNYFAGIYASTSWFANNLEDSQLYEYAHWVADYRGYCGYKGDKVMWQYTSGGTVAGISGRVDLNEAYIDFPAVIKAKGLNGYGAVQAGKPVEAIAEVPVRLVIGYASGGDLQAISRLLDEFLITYEIDEGFIYTEKMSTGDQLSVISLCNSLVIPVKEFKPVIITEQAGELVPGGGDDTTDKFDEETDKPATGEIWGDDEPPDNWIIRLIKLIIRLLKGV